MKPENRTVLIKYLACFGVAALITFVVFWIKGFFTDDLATNIQVLSDGFFVSGITMTMFAGALFIADEGGFIGLGFVLRNVVLTFIPMGRKKHELYKDYRERVLSQRRKKSLHIPLLIIGSAFLTAGIVFTVIWYVNFYNIV